LDCNDKELASVFVPAHYQNFAKVVVFVVIGLL